MSASEVYDRYMAGDYDNTVYVRNLNMGTLSTGVVFEPLERIIEGAITTIDPSSPIDLTVYDPIKQHQYLSQANYQFEQGFAIIESLKETGDTLDRVEWTLLYSEAEELIPKSFMTMLGLKLMPFPPVMF